MRYYYTTFLSSLFGYGQVLFEEISESVGFDFSNAIIFGTGVSFCDFDNDGWDDITVSGDDGNPIGFFQNIEGVFEEDVNANQTLTNVEGQSPLAIEEVHSNFDLQLYPNPSKDIVTLKTPDIIEGNNVVKIYNILGQLITTYPIENNEDLLQTYIRELIFYHFTMKEDFFLLKN